MGVGSLSCVCVYNKDKPIKHRIKSYILADLHTKCCCWNIDLCHSVSESLIEIVTAVLTR